MLPTFPAIHGPRLKMEAKMVRVVVAERTSCSSPSSGNVGAVGGVANSEIFEELDSVKY